MCLGAAFAATGCLAATGCNGQLGVDGDNGSAAGGTRPATTNVGQGEGGAPIASGTDQTEWMGNNGGAIECEVVPPEVLPLGRLTNEQYRQTLHTLLGVAPDLANEFPPDDTSHGFESGADSISTLRSDYYMRVAEDAAAQAVADLPAITGCAQAEVGSDACAASFIDDFGMRAFRRPLTADERDGLTALYRAGKSQYDFATGVEMVIMGALNAPQFLYHQDTVSSSAKAGEIALLDDFAMASRLSYFFWGTMPDAELLDAAATGGLRTETQIRAQATRLGNDPRANDAQRDFLRQWLHLDDLDHMEKDQAMYPGYTPATSAALKQSVYAFFEAVVAEDFTFDHLLTREGVFNSAEMEVVTGQRDGESETESGRRVGILAQPGLMAMLAYQDQSSPIHRALFVREKLFCQYLEPPADVNFEVPVVSPDATTRERFAAHTEQEACRSCHQLIDPLGFGFENYDGIGAYRTQENGKAVDSVGEVIGAEDANGPFTNVAELAEQLASSEYVQACFSKQVLRHAVRRIETASDMCSVAHLSSNFLQNGGDIASLMIEIAVSDAFRFRRAETPEEN